MFVCFGFFHLRIGCFHCVLGPSWHLVFCRISFHHHSYRNAIASASNINACLNTSCCSKTLPFFGFRGPFYPSPNNFTAVKLYLCATSTLSISISADSLSCFGVPPISSFSLYKWSFSRHREIDLEELWLESGLFRFWLLKPAWDYFNS